MLGWFSRTLAVLVLLAAVTLADEAVAQKGCDRFSAAEVTGTNPPIVRVSGLEGKSVYLCGYVIIHSGGTALEFELTSGIGDNCQTNTTILIPWAQF